MIKFVQIGQHLSERTVTGRSHHVRGSHPAVEVFSGAPVCVCVEKAMDQSDGTGSGHPHWEQ